MSPGASLIEHRVQELVTRLRECLDQAAERPLRQSNDLVADLVSTR